MKTTLSEQAYQWTDEDGGLHVGRLVQVNSLCITAMCGVVIEVGEDCEVLVRQSHTGTDEFVRWGKLSPYIVPAQFKDTPAEVQVKS